MIAKERNDLIISWLTISAAFALVLSQGILTRISVTLPIAFVGVGSAFIFHELAHRQVAIRFGAQAQFRAWKFGLILAILTALPVLFTGRGFIFAAPGAVYIYGTHITRKQNGLISLAGPIVNLIFGFVFLMLSVLFVIGSLAWQITFYGAMINFFWDSLI